VHLSVQKTILGGERNDPNKVVRHRCSLRTLPG
jgi:hypothetical protein